MTKIRKNRSLFRQIAIIGAVFITAVIYLSKPIQAAATVPFECSNSFYIGSSLTGSPTDFEVVNDTQDPFSFTNIATLSTLLNGFGFRVQDGFVYAIKKEDPNKNSLYRIDQNGDETNLGVPTGYPAATLPDEQGTFAGDFADDGLLYTIDRNDTGNALIATNVGTVTSTQIKVDLGVRPADIAYNPKTDLFYGYDALIDRFFSLSTVGTVTHFGPTYSFGTNGAAWFDSLGHYYSYENTTGTIRQINIDLSQGQLGAVLRSVPATIVDNNDGTSCPYSPYLSKDATPRTVQQNSVVTYTYEITNNHLSDTITTDFEDIMPDSRTFVAGSLVSDAGGTVGSYGGTNTLSIDGISIPANTTRTISVDVQIPADFAVGDATNQAFLHNVTGDFNPAADYPSDDPSTIIRFDETAIAVTEGDVVDVIPGVPDAGFIKSKNHLIILMLLVSGVIAVPIIKKIRLKRSKLH